MSKCPSGACSPFPPTFRALLTFLVVVTFVLVVFVLHVHDLILSSPPHWDLPPVNVSGSWYRRHGRDDSVGKLRVSVNLDVHLPGEETTEVSETPTTEVSETPTTEVSETPITAATEEDLPQCPIMSPHLREIIPLNLTSMNMSELERDLSPERSRVRVGGMWRPEWGLGPGVVQPESRLGAGVVQRVEPCVSRHKRTTVVLIPYRDRSQHLIHVLRHLHHTLQRQLVPYWIVVIEQTANSLFNRGKLLNVGFSETFKNDSSFCYILQDVDYLVESDFTSYTCDEVHPKHLVVVSSNFNYKPIYSSYFGAVSAMTGEQYRRVNGFSNMFWGWGGEDDDLYNRIVWHNMSMIRPGSNDDRPMIGRYFMMTHKKDNPSAQRMALVSQGKLRKETDGLNNLSYQLLNKEEHSLYTRLLVDLHQPSVKT